MIRWTFKIIMKIKTATVVRMKFTIGPTRKAKNAVVTIGECLQIVPLSPATIPSNLLSMKDFAPQGHIKQLDST